MSQIIRDGSPTSWAREKRLRKEAREKVARNPTVIEIKRLMEKLENDSSGIERRMKLRKIWDDYKGGG